MIKKILTLDEYLYTKLVKFSNNLFIKFISYFGNIFFTLGFIILLFFLPIKGAKESFIISSLTFVLHTSIVFILKYSIKRERAYSNKDLLHTYDPYSFPSGHISRLGGFIFSTYYLFLFPFIFLFLSVAVTFSRITRGYHYFSDCLVGFIIGLFSGLACLVFYPAYSKIIFKLLEQLGITIF